MWIGIWFLMRAHFSIIPQKLTFLYKFGDINMRSIIFSSCPLFYIGFPFSVASIRFLTLILASKYSTYFLLAIYFLFYIRWWALKSPKSMISPLTSLIAILT